MDNSTIGIAILWVLLFVYSILGSIDFGAGFWAMVFERGRVTRGASLANRYLSPTWKLTNVFLVLFVVALVGFFPRATYVLASLLLVPVCLVLVLLTLRSTFMVYAYSMDRYRRALGIVSGVTGMLIPALLVSVLPVTLGGFIGMTPGGPALDYGRLLSSPTEYAHLAFGFATELFLSALFLADYAREAEDETSYLAYRRAAILLGPATLLTALLVTYSMVPEASWIVANIREQALWFALSTVAFAFGYSALFWPEGQRARSRRRGSKGAGGVGARAAGSGDADGTGAAARVGRPRAAVVLIVAQYALASYAYGAAHQPFIVYPFVTVQAGFTNPLMFHSLLIGYSVGIVVLVPAFILFWRLFLKDKRYLQRE